jgi:phenylalanyl-tRNA synthetase beta chain
MLFLRSWLQDYINLTDFTDQQLVDLITAHSSEVDGFEKIVDPFNGFVVAGKITNIRKHTTADFLNIFDVEIEKGETVQIVSAATNVKNGLIVPLAKVGARLPFFNVGAKKLKGVESFGLCLGKSEIALETSYSSGLWELQEQYRGSDLESHLGSSVAKLFPELFPIDVVFDVKVLPDKIAVIGSHLGMAKELSIILPNGLDLLTELGKQLLDPDYIDTTANNINDNFDVSEQISVDDKVGVVNNFELYAMELETEYNLPHLFQLRMFKLGQNLIGGMADLTNYILLDIGQPSHVFDSKILD